MSVLRIYFANNILKPLLNLQCSLSTYRIRNRIPLSFDNWIYLLRTSLVATLFHTASFNYIIIR